MAQNDVEVSVLCIAYNHEKYIRKALDAFVTQKTNFKYEVLINDDASTDNTAEIIREYEEKYPDIIKPYYQTENQYSQKKSNLQFLGERAKGKYFAFCEGDDYWTDTDKLQKQYDVMVSNPNIVLCVHKVQCVNEDMSPNAKVIPEKRLNLNQNRLITPDEFSDILFVRGSYAFHTSSYFVTRELFLSEERRKMIGRMNGDQVIMSCSLLYGDVYYINETMSHRRMMTIGNSHQRFTEYSVEKKVSHLLKYYKGCSFFDEISDYRYHKKLIHRVYLGLICVSLQYNHEIVDDYFKEVRKKMKFNWFISFKLDVVYIMFHICPWLLKKLLKL